MALTSFRDLIIVLYHIEAKSQVIFIAENLKKYNIYVIITNQIVEWRRYAAW